MHAPALTPIDAWRMFARKLPQTELHLMAKAKSASFEQSLETLEQLVKQMDSGELSLEASLEAFEKGIGLIRQCQTQLQQAEQKVQQLVENQAGFSLAPFEDDKI